MAAFDLVFLGTGAADWPVRPQADVRYDTDGLIRRTCSLLINGKYLIDPAPESWFFAVKVLKLDLSGLKAVILTHSHGDHFSLKALDGFLGEARGKVGFYCHEGTIPSLKLTEKELSRMRLHPLKTGDRVKLGKVTMQALGANHEVSRTRETALHYLFACEGKKFFYGCDGAWFLAQTWSVLRKHELDLAIMEATVGSMRANYRIASHNTLAMVDMLVEAMEECGILRKDSLVVLSHLSRELHRPDEDYGSKIVAYDGMWLEI